MHRKQELRSRIGSKDSAYVRAPWYQLFELKLFYTRKNAATSGSFETLSVENLVEFASKSYSDYQLQSVNVTREQFSKLLMLLPFRYPFESTEDQRDIYTSFVRQATKDSAAYVHPANATMLVNSMIDTDLTPISVHACDLAFKFLSGTQVRWQRSDTHSLEVCASSVEVGANSTPVMSVASIQRCLQRLVRYEERTLQWSEFLAAMEFLAKSISGRVPITA